MGNHVAQKSIRTNGGKNKTRAGKSKSAEECTSLACPIVPHSKHRAALPLPFPPNFPRPTGSFLRSEPPYEKSFQVAVETAYEGFVVDLDEVTGATKKRKRKESKETSFFPHESIQQALKVMEAAGLFRTDVTQPFGLGTKCAKTYVTRCLLGERGTTYKYLGLRMFAHPWDGLSGQANESFEAEGEINLASAVEIIRQLNEKLTERTKFHLSALSQKRVDRGADPTRGRAAFDITLINRMEYSADLKKEPSIGEGRCSVAWHADSSLEHYSTIAVYHTIRKETCNKDEEEGAWSVALRVAHNSEGPSAPRRGTDIESSIVAETPPIAVSLPSGSAYYLLDDFNHHHQHTVISSGEGAGVRFSSTHRLLRESHNVNFLLERCKNVLSNFHKKGLKTWRSEQLLLTELESEWLRQYYIQGKQHHDLLSKSWGDEIMQLLRYWSQFETRTKHTIDYLQAAAEGRCMASTTESVRTGAPRHERKVREKRKKACLSLQDLVSRSSDIHQSGPDMLFEGFATLLEDRATMRELWTKREADHVFCEMNSLYTPLPVPFVFNVITEAATVGDQCTSPMQGLPSELRSIASNLRCWGKAFVSGLSDDLPDSLKVAASCKKSKIEVGSVSPSTGIEHVRPLTWEGWGQHEFGLELQAPWAELLLEGKKKVETRAYDLPPALLGRRIAILQSVKGCPGMSSLGDVVHIDSADDEPVVKIIGWCTFRCTILYPNRETFEADEDVHLVRRDSGFGWSDNPRASLYGWAVGEVGKYSDDESNSLHSIIRRMRSFFQLRRLPNKPT